MAISEWKSLNYAKKTLTGDELSGRPVLLDTDFGVIEGRWSPAKEQHAPLGLETPWALINGTPLPWPLVRAWRPVPVIQCRKSGEKPPAAVLFLVYVKSVGWLEAYFSAEMQTWMALSGLLRTELHDSMILAWVEINQAGNELELWREGLIDQEVAWGSF